MHILLVEDDAMLAAAVQSALQATGATVDHAADAPSAKMALVDHRYSAVLLDLGLPGGSGLSVLQALRARYDATPVLIITARDRLSERIAGLDAGADDYLVKPFQLDELNARLRAVLRRARGRVAPVLAYRDVVLDPAQRMVSRQRDNGESENVPLSVSEYRVLLALMERQGRVVTRDQLEDAVYGDAGTLESNTIAVYVHQLRRKLGEDFIATVHGYGYRVGAPAGNS
ncbi:MAG TPA: response regulator transcription factor [Burkholderiaceae bacterium]|nr:response regulator transcription factor [Burkholderiaceae bacterium]